MGMQISCGVYSEVSEEGTVKGIAPIFGGNVPKACGAEGVPGIGRAFTAGSCTYVDIDTAEIFGISSNRVYKREERNPHSARIWGEEAKFCR